MVAPVVAAAGIGAAASGIGKVADKIFGDKSAKQNWKQQKKVLQNQVQWRVEDSVKAGLHPLAALGMAPAAVGGTYVGGTDFGSMGQDIGRAAEAMLTPENKNTAHLAQLAVERGGLENELLRTQIASQRMRLVQMGTPGVDNAANAATLNTPFGAPLAVANKGLSQDANDDFGEIIGELYGIGNFIQSQWNRQKSAPDKTYVGGFNYSGQSAIQKAYEDFLKWYNSN